MSSTRSPSRYQVEQIKIQNTNVITTTTTGGNSLASSSTTGGQQIVIQHQPTQATITTTAANPHQTTQIIKEVSDGTIQIQQHPSPTQTLNAQVCLDSMALSDVDVRTNPFCYRNIDVVTIIYCSSPIGSFFSFSFDVSVRHCRLFIRVIHNCFIFSFAYVMCSFSLISYPYK